MYLHQRQEHGVLKRYIHDLQIIDCIQQRLCKLYMHGSSQNVRNAGLDMGLQPLSAPRTTLGNVVPETAILRWPPSPRRGDDCGSARTHCPMTRSSDSATAGYRHCNVQVENESGETQDSVIEPRLPYRAACDVHNCDSLKIWIHRNILKTNSLKDEIKIKCEETR